MNLHLSLTPSGALLPHPGPDSQIKAGKALSAFQSVFKEQGEAAALFDLAIAPDASQLAHASDFWRGFSTRWLRERCLLDAKVAAETRIDVLTEKHAQSLINSAPLMDGAEYLSTELLQSKWLNRAARASSSDTINISRGIRASHIKKLRQTHQLTQPDLAQLTGNSLATIRKWEARSGVLQLQSSSQQALQEVFEMAPKQIASAIKQQSK